MVDDASFLGTGWAFPPAFEGAGHGARMADGADDVRQSLHILLTTTPGERVMQPAYGCSLKRLVFEHIDQGTLTEIRAAVEQAVLFFEVRVTLHHVSIDTSRLFEGELRVGLDYTLRTTNSRHNAVFPFYFEQGTGLRDLP